MKFLLIPVALPALALAYSALRAGAVFLVQLLGA